MVNPEPVYCMSVEFSKEYADGKGKINFIHKFPSRQSRAAEKGN
jgi:hypothetical protein